MAFDLATALALTALFAVLGAHAIVRASTARRPRDLLEQACHLLMAVAMAAMVWPVWTAVPVVPVLAAFGVMALWFLGRAVRGGDDHGRSACLGHALMAVAMVWMVAAMAGAPSGSEHHHGGPLTVLTGLGLLVTAALVVAAVVLAADGVADLAVRAPGRRVVARDSVSGALMCLGMVAMTWPMSVG